MYAGMVPLIASSSPPAFPDVTDAIELSDDHRKAAPVPVVSSESDAADSPWTSPVPFSTTLTWLKSPARSVAPLASDS